MGSWLSVQTLAACKLWQPNFGNQGKSFSSCWSAGVCIGLSNPGFIQSQLFQCFIFKFLDFEDFERDEDEGLILKECSETKFADTSHNNMIINITKVIWQTKFADTSHNNMIINITKVICLFLMKDLFGELFEAEYTYLFRKLFLFTK